MGKPSSSKIPQTRPKAKDKGVSSKPRLPSTTKKSEDKLPLGKGNKNEDTGLADEEYEDDEAVDEPSPPHSGSVLRQLNLLLGQRNCAQQND
jgi:hypothetical protein